MFHYDMKMWNFGYKSFNPRSMSLAMIQDNTKTALSKLDRDCIDPDTVKDQDALFWQVGEYMYYYNKATFFKVTEKKAMDKSCEEKQMVRFSDDPNQDNKAVFKIAKDFGMDLDSPNRNIICVERHVDENGQNYKPKPVDNCGEEWGEVEGKCYKLFTKKADNVQDAVYKCASQGAELYRPRSKVEETKVTTLVQGVYGHPGDYFIGMYYDFSFCFPLTGCHDESWKYYCGEERGKQKCGQKVSYSNWDSGQPDYGFDSPQEAICITKNKKWDNCYGMLEDYSRAPHAYLCQKSI